MKNKSISFVLALTAAFIWVAAIEAEALKKPKARIDCDAPRFVLDNSLNLWVDEMLKVDPGKNLILDPKGCDLREISCTAEGDNRIILVDQICSILHYEKDKPRHMKPTGEKKVVAVKVRMTANGILSVIK